MKILKNSILPVLIICSSIVMLSCNGQQYDISEETYELHKKQMEKAEENNPEKFLSVKTTTKKNLLGQTIVNGTIFNSAKVATYKDIEIKIQFYSKTNALLEEDVETIYEMINAGGSKKFKSKYFSPKGTDKATVTIQKASFVP